LYITDAIESIARFCIENAGIPQTMMRLIVSKIEQNTVISKQMDAISKEIDCIEASKQLMADNSQRKAKANRSGKITKNMDNNEEMKTLKEQLELYRNQLTNVCLNETFIPNKMFHLKKWAEHYTENNSFTSDVDEQTVRQIMELNVDEKWKLLLMMGIGVFMAYSDVRYIEIMKSLAEQQRLYMIIASSDYIYGTNYQYCHGFLGKDLRLTKEKLIQALGRFGRNNVQNDYTIRFRDDMQVSVLFQNNTNPIEVNNMNRLFV
jgi:hypothetical protein